MRGVRLFLSLTVLLTGCVKTMVLGHGYLKVPASRNYVANSNYCPQCLNAAPTNANGEDYPNGAHGICGDPYQSAQPRDHEVNGKFWTGKSQATYEEGQVVELNVYVTAYHKGNFEFRICKINGTSAEDEAAQMTEGCLEQHVLTQANVVGAQRPGDRYFYIGPTADNLVGGNNWDYTMYFQLPKGLTCDGKSSRCVMQWHWITGNSCNPPGTLPQYSSPQLPICGPNSAYPEEFWNCADITIMPFSKNSSGSPGMSPEPTPSPSTPTPGPSTPTPSPSTPNDLEAFCATIISSGKPYGFYSDASRGCKGFYLCNSLGSYYLGCPMGTAFSDTLSYCAASSEVNCTGGEESISPSTPSPSPNPMPSSNISTFCQKTIAMEGKPYGFYADVASGCIGYYMCDVTSSSYYYCPDGLIFNQKTAYCDYPSNAKCSTMNETDHLTSPSPAAPVQDPAVAFCDSIKTTDSPYGFFVNPQSGCTSYYLCDESGSWSFDCPAGTLFNDKVSYCDWPTNVNC